MRLEKSDVIRALHEQPSFSEVFVAHLLSRNTRIEEDLVDQLFNSSEKRLARVLLLLANFGKEGTPQTVIPKMSQETLAGIIGTTRSRVSFFMNRIRKLGFIRSANSPLAYAITSSFHYSSTGFNGTNGIGASDPTRVNACTGSRCLE